MPTPDEIFEKVQETLADALGVDEDEVTREATLQADLGAESIDFLDIVFRLGKNFNVNIGQGELFPEGLMDADAGYVADGLVTEKGIATLREKMPFANVDQLAADPKAENVANLYTVGMICNFLEKKLAK